MDTAEIALAYVLGSLSPIERAETAQRRLYDLGLDRAIVAEEARLAGLGQMPLAAPPADRLWDRIAGAVSAQEQAWSSASLQSFSDGDWIPYAPRIDAKELWSERSLLLRCGPGALEPAHQQSADEDEHVLVLAGDLEMGGRTMTAGDYVRVTAGAHHAEMTSRGGCILLMHYTPVAA